MTADLFSNLALGFGVAFTPVNLGLCLIGALVGTLVGVLPGIGTIATVAMLLPRVQKAGQIPCPSGSFMRASMRIVPVPGMTLRRPSVLRRAEV